MQGFEVLESREWVDANGEPDSEPYDVHPCEGLRDVAVTLIRYIFGA